MKIWKISVEARETLVVFADDAQEALEIASKQAEYVLVESKPTLDTPVEVPPGVAIEGISENYKVYHGLGGDLPLWEARRISEEEHRKRAAEAEFRRRQLEMFSAEKSYEI
jgi:hypothetical protein